MEFCLDSYVVVVVAVAVDVEVYVVVGSAAVDHYVAVDVVHKEMKEGLFPLDQIFLNIL